VQYPQVLRQLKRLGHDSFRLDGPPVIYIDPWKLRQDMPKADLVLVTHDHYDHCSPEDIAKISQEGTVVIGNPGAAQKIGSKARALRPGESLTFANVTVTAVPAYNTNKFRSPGEPFHPQGDQGNGYIITIDDEKLYHAGDTDFIPEMSQVQATVALLPVSGTYVMTAEEAFEAAQVIKAEYFVPMHYGDIVGDQGDVEKFRYLCESQGLRAVVLSTSEDPS
jgi:L-ascorbate metabolism protein UlaG (beta-lactamase superfamily)